MYKETDIGEECQQAHKGGAAAHEQAISSQMPPMKQESDSENLAAGLGSPDPVLPSRIGASKGAKTTSMAPLRKRKTDVESVPPEISDKSPDYQPPGHALVNTKKQASSNSTEFMSLPGQGGVLGSNSSTLRQMEALIYDYTNREQSIGEKMHKLKVNFFQAMKQDDEYVSRGLAKERRSSFPYRKGSQVDRGSIKGSLAE